MESFPARFRISDDDVKKIVDVILAERQIYPILKSFEKFFHDRVPEIETRYSEWKNKDVFSSEDKREIGLGKVIEE